MSVSVLDPETDIMEQFLDPETDIMGERTFMPIHLNTYWQLAIFLSKIMNFKPINTRIFVLNRIFVQKTGIPIRLKRIGIRF